MGSALPPKADLLGTHEKGLLLTQSGQSRLSIRAIGTSKILQDSCQVHIIRISRKAASTSYNPKRFQISRSSIAAKTSAARFSVYAKSKPPLDRSAIPPFGHKNLKYFALVIDGTPEVVRLPDGSPTKASK